MNEWITDRRPTEDDGKYVYSPYGNVCLWSEFRDGEPWKPIPKCDPYVKPKRYKVMSAEDIGLAAPAGYFCVYDTLVGYDTLLGCKVTSWLPTREAAERIAAIYEEVMP